MYVVQCQLSEIPFVEYLPIYVGTTGYGLDYDMLTTFEPIKEKLRNIDVISTFNVFDTWFAFLSIMALLLIYFSSYVFRYRYLYRFLRNRKSKIEQDHYGYDIMRAVLFTYDFNVNWDSLRILIILC